MSTHTPSGDDHARTAAVAEGSNADEDDHSGELPPDSLILRLHRALGPLAGGMILDGLDFFTRGPVGVMVGLFIGMPIGWWISSIYGFTIPSRLLCATLAGVYCMTPGTELIPLATIIAAVARFYAGEPEALQRDRARRAKSA
jgi:NhaP-type Na+/H+ or K+/H+ antiporter